MKLRSLIPFGAAAFVCMLLVQAPADLLYGWLAPRAAAVKLVGVDGSLADGSAATLMLDGRPLLRAVRWQLEPWRLLLLHGSFHVEGAGDGTNVDGHIAFSPLGMALRGLQLEGPVKSLLGSAGIGFAPLAGDARLQLKSLALKHGFPAAAEGQLQVAGLAWALGKDPVPLGDFRATVSTQADAIVAHVEPVAGPLDLNGDVRLHADRSYDCDLKLKARSGAAPALDNLLGTLGAPDAQGYRRLHSQGKLAGPA